MPNRPHHSPKMKRCVNKVGARGGGYNPYAVCGASLKKTNSYLYVGRKGYGGGKK